MKRLIASLVLLFASFYTSFSTLSTPVYADNNGGGCGGSSAFFALKPWYEGLVDGSCNMKAPDGTADGMAKYVWTIVLNILYDITVFIGYIAIIVIAWGGYLYMFSSGDPGKAAKGKKTLIAAVIGLAISMLASVIMNTISAILIG